MKHWNELTDEEFIAASKEFTSKEGFARKFGLSRTNRSFNDRLVGLKISYSAREKYDSVSKERFIDAVSKSSSIVEVIEALGYPREQNYRYRQVRHLSRLYGVTLPVYDHYVNSRSGASKRATSHGEFFTPNVSRSGTDLRNRMVAAGVPYVCSISECPLSSGEMVWCGKQIVLQVDHIDGDHTNNLLTNLQFLCANCHTQTKTFTNRKKSGEAKSKVCSCGRNVASTSKSCTHPKVDTVDNPLIVC